MWRASGPAGDGTQLDRQALRLRCKAGARRRGQGRTTREGGGHRVSGHHAGGGGRAVRRDATLRRARSRLRPRCADACPRGQGRQPCVEHRRARRRSEQCLRRGIGRRQDGEGAVADRGCRRDTEVLRHSPPSLRVEWPSAPESAERVYPQCRREPPGRPGAAESRAAPLPSRTVLVYEPRTHLSVCGEGPLWRRRR